MDSSLSQSASIVGSQYSVSGFQNARQFQFCLVNGTLFITNPTLTSSSFCCVNKYLLLSEEDPGTDEPTSLGSHGI
jgi:hypothetical protein